MAKHLASIHGTEEDKVNCPFYFKIGACRHSDRCSRLHHKPAFSQTLLVKHLYQHPVRLAELQQAAGVVATTTTNANNNNTNAKNGVDPEQALEDFLCFYEDMYMEFSKFGRLEALHVVDNLGDHMIGHVYVKFFDEEQASDALQVMNGRYYDGRMMQVEFSPVTDFREARCRDFDEDACARGGFCNFLHVKPVPMCLIRSLEDDADDDRRQQQRREEEQQQQDAAAREERRREKKRKRDRESGDRKSSSSSRHKSSSSSHHHHHRHHRRSKDHDGAGASDYSEDEQSGSGRGRSSRQRHSRSHSTDKSGSRGKSRSKSPRA